MATIKFSVEYILFIISLFFSGSIIHQMGWHFVATSPDSGWFYLVDFSLVIHESRMDQSTNEYFWHHAPSISGGASKIFRQK